MAKNIPQATEAYTSTIEALAAVQGQELANSIPKFHWRPDPHDARDHIFRLSAPLSATPTRVDLRPYASAIEDQGNLGSCTGNAIAGCIELILMRTNKRLDVSRLFIYYQERLLEGTISYDSGAYIRDGIKACNKVGVSTELLWPYNISKFAINPTPQAYADASRRKVISYSRCDTFDSVKTALASGNPVVGGFWVYSSFVTPAVARNGMMPYPNVNREQFLGGHAVCFVGYDDNTQRFIVRNSWGTSWGDRGYFYMPYQVVQNTNMSADFWTISGVTNP